MTPKNAIDTVMRLRALGGGWRGTVRRAIGICRTEGLNGIRRRLLSHGFGFSFNPAKGMPPSGAAAFDYPEWCRRYSRWDSETVAAIRKQVDGLKKTPLFSALMPVFDPPLAAFQNAIESLIAQVYGHWELCIVDDASKNPEVRGLIEKYVRSDNRIIARHHTVNGHISRASNSALEMASGEFIALVDHDDVLAPDALYWMAEYANAHPDAGILYSDEDKIDDAGTRFSPYFKCDWNYELFLSHNMITHLGVYRKSLVEEVGGFREGFEGAQDYDLALRCIEQLDAAQIVHIPRILYHWRMHEMSTASSHNAKPYAMLAGERALNEHLRRTGRKGRATLEQDHSHYRVRFDLPKTPPLVSVIIALESRAGHARRCVESVLSRTTYPCYEVILVPSDHDFPDSPDWLESLGEDARIIVLKDEGAGCSSALYNRGARAAEGEILALLHDDIEVLTPQWLEEMVSLALQPQAGAVGARLWSPEGTLQHGGLILMGSRIVGSSHKNIRKGNPGYAGRGRLLQSYSAVSGACLVIKASTYRELNGLDEKNLSDLYNDVDLCLRAKELGLHNIWTPYAELTHRESGDSWPESSQEYEREKLSGAQAYMRHRWGQGLFNDPAFNPNLTLDREDFALAWPPRTIPATEDRD